VTASTGRDGPFDTLAAVQARALDLLAAPSPLLIVSDFDGTLAPIALEPNATRIVPVARLALRTLARVAEQRPDRVEVAVLSGRMAADVAGFVRVGGLRYLGSHGMESGRLARGGRPERLEVAMDPSVRRHVPAVAAVSTAVEDRLGRPDWLFVEPKGPSVGFHFRRAPDPDAARLAILEALQAEELAGGMEGLVRLESRKIIELRPVGASGKGGALERLIEETHPGAVLVLGDDRTDADAFRVARAWRASGGGRALAVGVHGAAETPAEVVETSDVLLRAPAEAARLLAAVARALERERSRA
jgi:trehalose 6-phosphate phosphatase